MKSFPRRQCFHFRVPTSPFTLSKPKHSKGGSGELCSVSAERTDVSSPEKTKVTDSRAPTPALEIYRTTEALGGGTKNPCALFHIQAP